LWSGMCSIGTGARVPYPWPLLRRVGLFLPCFRAAHPGLHHGDPFLAIHGSTSLALSRGAPSRSLGSIFSPTQGFRPGLIYFGPFDSAQGRLYGPWRLGVLGGLALIRGGKEKSAPSLRSGFPLGFARGRLQRARTPAKRLNFDFARGRLQRARTPAKRLNFDFARGSASRCSASASSLALARVHFLAYPGLDYAAPYRLSPRSGRESVAHGVSRGRIAMRVQPAKRA